MTLAAGPGTTAGAATGTVLVGTAMTTTTRAPRAEAESTPVYKAAIARLQNRGFRYLYLLDFIALMGSMVIVML